MPWKLDFNHQSRKAGIGDQDIASAAQYKNGAAARPREFQRVEYLLFSSCMKHKAGRTADAQSGKGRERDIFQNWQSCFGCVHISGMKIA